MKKKLPLFCLALLAMLAFSCQKEPSSSGDKTEKEIVGDMLTNDQLQVLKSMDMPIHSGDNPPDITGYFNASDLDCVKDSTGLYLKNLIYYYNFHNKDGQEIELDYFNEGKGDVATGKGAYIFGEGNDFTVYMETEGKISGTSITYTHVSLYSGTLTANGIANFTQGFIMTSKKNDEGGQLMPVNATRIYQEGDMLASKLSSNPGFTASVQYLEATDKPAFLVSSGK